jgi:hypothetical protein
MIGVSTTSRALLTFVFIKIEFGFSDISLLILIFIKVNAVNPNQPTANRICKSISAQAANSS